MDLLDRLPAEDLGGPEEHPLRELAWLFLRLGATAFGGPAAHIAMMQDEVVRRRGWLTGEDWPTSLKFANACGAFAVSRHGCTPAM